MAQIIAQEVYDHDVFGAILAGCQQRFGRLRIPLRVIKARSGTLNWLGIHPAAVDTQKPLRRQGDDGVSLPQPEKSRVVSRSNVFQGVVEAKIRAPKMAGEALGDIGLIAITCSDELPHPGHFFQVFIF